MCCFSIASFLAWNSVANSAGDNNCNEDKGKWYRLDCENDAQRIASNMQITTREKRAETL